MKKPSETGDNGRDERGRFTPGNKAARGNPYARRVAQLRSALLRAVSADDVQAVARKLVEQAKAGDVQAARVLLDRLFGPAVPLDFVERLSEIEKALEEVRKCGG